MADGIIIIDKAQGWTSMDVCAKLRGVLHTKKIGHAGTLDPMATGVLPVFVGRATRAVSFAEESEKEYIATLQLGITTDTQDTEGTVLETKPVFVKKQDLERTLPLFTGQISQIPPMYSAIKVHGQKLCDLARKGKEIERQSRQITIHSIELLRQESETSYVLRVCCSKGTYIRTLLQDIGTELGCGGCMSSLRRTRVAGFTLADAYTIEDVEQQGEILLRPLDSLFMQYPAYTLKTERQSQLCHNGNAFYVKDIDTEDIYRIYDLDGKFLSLNRLEDGNMQVIKNFFGVN